MEFDGTTVPGPSFIRNLNADMLKQEPPEEIPLDLLQDQVQIKLESVSTEDEIKSVSLNILEPEVIGNQTFDVTFQTLGESCHVESDKSIKEELLIEEFNIKCEAKAIQEPNHDDIDNYVNQFYQPTESPNGVKLFRCHICDYSCQWKTNLNRHLRTHPEKPFKCNI